MELTNAIKRAPRWAWVTAGGIGLGAAGIKLWTNRDKPDGDPATATEIGDPSSPYPLPTSTGNPVATIVPPVILQPPGSDSNQGVGELQNLYVNAVGGIIQAYQDVWGPVQTASTSLLLGNAQAIQNLAMAGPAPNSNTTQPEAILPYAPPAPAAPIPLPTPATVAKPVSACGTCKPPYPYCNESARACYTVACASGAGAKKKGKWHLYAGRPDQYIGPKC